MFGSARGRRAHPRRVEERVAVGALRLEVEERVARPVAAKRQLRLTDALHERRGHVVCRSLAEEAALGLGRLRQSTAFVRHIRPDALL